MRNYIILNNQRSDEISGLIIQELAPISKPLQRTQVETIDGRDGDIVTPLGYAAYDKKITIGLYGNFDINEIIAYFATQGTAIFSNEPDKYYNYQILDQIDYERLVRFRVATVTMHVQPFKYSATEGTLTIDASDTVSGEGSNIVLENTAEAPFTTLRHKGNAMQKTYTGKNLFSGDFSQFNSQGGTGSTYAYFKLPTDGVYTLSLVAKNAITATGRYIGFSRHGGNAESYKWIYQNNNNIAAGQVFSGTNIISGENLGFVFMYPKTSDDLQWLVDNFEIQLEAGSTRTDFEPYVGNLPSPSPDYPQDIKLLTGDSTIAIDDGGDNSQEYVIPFGDTYLAAVGDYADEPVKVGDTWYIRRAIDRVVLNGGENWTLYPNKAHTFRCGAPHTMVTAISDHFVSIPSSQFDTVVGTYTTNTGTFIISYPDMADVASFKAWLANNQTTFYYALPTPTDEEITDQDLIDALDEFYGQAHSYKGHTHIAATAEDGNAPAILSVEVGEDNEATVTNAGNTTSRPIITIYGQGDIGVYINDVEVLDIALGNEQYITLDSTEMDAYKDSPANLKNRLVTGDYSKLALNAGANKIRFTGNVTKYEISKYSRWL